MPCTPLSIATGFFIPGSWSTAPTQTVNGRTITRTASGIAVEGPGGSVFHPTPLGHDSRYQFLGTDGHVAILDIETGIGPSQRRVSVVEFGGSGPVEHGNILSVLASSNAIAPPILAASPGNGAVFFGSASNGSEIATAAIYRSRDGHLLCPGPGSWVATGETQAEATATHLVIHYSVGGTSHTKTCPKPQGACDVTPAAQTFADVVIGGAPSSTTRTFTIRNTGDDCLIVNAIGNVAPYTATPDRALPADLNPGQTMMVTVTFAPTAVGSYDRDLPVTRTPAVGDDELVCHGEARLPVRSLTVTPGSLAFGSVVVGTSSSLSAQVRNTGEAPLNVSWPAQTTGVFRWNGWSGQLAPGAAQPLQVTFEPTGETPESAMVPLTHDATTGPTSVSLSGRGCVPNAVIGAPPTAPVQWGDVQRGFRLARLLRVRNDGDAPLTFEGRVEGPQAALFSLVDPDGSLSGGPTRSYTVLPTAPCGGGPAGPGFVDVAVLFFADQAPGDADATLVLHTHNGSNTTPATYSYPLHARVVAGVPVDAVAVLDHSGSMSEPAGAGGTKTDVEVGAARLFVQLAREGVEDRLALVRFSTTPVTFRGMQEVTAGNHTAIADAITTAELAPAGSTCIAGGAIEAFRQFAVPRTTTPPQLTKAVVVLTDGKDNTPYHNPDDGRWYSLLGGWVPTLPGLPFTGVDTEPVAVPAGVKMYGIGLGRDENIDHARLDAMSGMTGGYYGVVDTSLSGAPYFNLQKYFTQIYLDIVGSATILDPMFTIQSGSEQRIEFDVLRGDVNALAVVYDLEGKRLPFHLESPRGELLDAFHAPAGFALRRGWTETARFVEVGMPVGDPDRYAGRWAVVVRHPGKVCYGESPTWAKQPRTKKRVAEWGFVGEKCRPSREPVDYGIAIGVGSNFRMQPYVTPGIVHVGDPLTLTAVLTEAGLRVTGATVTATVRSPGGSVWAVSLRDDGAHNDGEGGDGEYARRFVHTVEAGSYEIAFRAEGHSRDGEPVVREAVLAKYVEGRVPVGPQRPSCECPRPTPEQVKEWDAYVERDSQAAAPKRTRKR